jgi:pimeloyl-ACP methyl ester carboxylesterase
MSDLLLIHGLTYDHRTWGPLRERLAPGQRLLTIDLPGHGSAAQWEAYPLDELAESIHKQVASAGLSNPVVVGHSVGAIIGNTYAARFPASAMVNLDQVLMPGPFFSVVREAEPLLRGPRWREFWDRMVAGMGVEALPGEARELVRTATTPRQDLLLGYWDEILQKSDEEIRERTEQELRVIAGRGIAYHYVSSGEPSEPYLRWLRSLVPNAEVTVVPGGHFPHLADPAAVADVLARY